MNFDLSTTVDFAELQTFDGHWNLQDILKVFNLKKEELDKHLNMATNEQKMDMAVKATLFAIAVLRVLFAKYKEEWELLVQKAFRWIHKSLNSEEVEQLIKLL